MHVPYECDLCAILQFLLKFDTCVAFDNTSFTCCKFQMAAHFIVYDSMRLILMANSRRKEKAKYQNTIEWQIIRNVL